MTSPLEKPDFEQRLIESFSKHAKSYDRHAQLQKSMAERLSTFLPSPLPDPILELGCGTGLFTRHLLARKVSHLILNDLAPAMVDYLKKNLNLPLACSFITGNAENMTFPPTQAIVANAVFQWLRNPEATLRHLASFLKPKGYLVFSTFGPGTLEELRQIGSFEGPTALMSQEQWSQLLTEAGFKTLRVEKEERQIFFDNTRELMRNLQQIGAAPLRLLKPGDLKNLIKQYDERFTTPQGVYTRWELIYFLAQGSDDQN